jgi:hypothetical protein
LVGCLSACGSPNVIESAFYGDLASLKKEIAAAQQSGALDDRGSVEALARAVARRELRSSKGRSAVDRVRDLRLCAKSVLPELEEKARALDDAGAEATLVLGELGERDLTELTRKYAQASSGAWRAVAARGASSRRDGALRRRFVVDPDERVRRQALSAALALRDPADLPTLLEAARLDPDLLNRSFAARAAGHIGGGPAVLALKDLFPRATEGDQLAIVEAWSFPESFKAGGDAQLLRIAESDVGLARIAAAQALARSDGSAAPTGNSVLVRAVKEGALDERRLAIRLVPLSTDGATALLDASRDADKHVAMLADARLLHSSSHRAPARERLRALAKESDSVGREARAALAAVQDSSVTTLLRAELSAQEPARRRYAATALMRLGGYSAAAAALADDDPAVRVGVACALLGGAPAPR